MSSVDKALETQLHNIQTKTGQPLEALIRLIQTSGLSKHSEIRQMLQRDLGLGYGDANTLAHVATKAGSAAAGETAEPALEQLVEEMYTGGKAPLRPIHDKLMAAINQFGPLEIAPKKGYVSLRRKRQFAMITPATQTRVEVGLNLKEAAATERLIAMPKGSMCQFKVNVTEADQVDGELLAWIKAAYDGSA